MCHLITLKDKSVYSCSCSPHIFFMAKKQHIIVGFKKWRESFKKWGSVLCSEHELWINNGQSLRDASYWFVDYCLKPQAWHHCHHHLGARSDHTVRNYKVHEVAKRKRMAVSFQSGRKCTVEISLSVNKVNKPCSFP